MKGHLTFNETGKLAYQWLVTANVKGYKFWQGKEPGGGTPKHPPRKIFDNPEVFEFGTPVGGTYPPWHDPTYWYEGIKFKFDFKRQLRILARNAVFYYRTFLGSLVFCYLILICAGGKFWLSLKEFRENWILLIPAAVGLGIYALGTDLKSAFIETQPSTRYVAPFIVLLVAGVFSSVRLPDSHRSKKLIAVMVIATLITVSSQLTFQASKDLWTVLSGSQQHAQWQMATRLNQLGVHPGDKVALLGYKHPYWARLARVKIVAEVVEPRNFWEKDTAVRTEVLKTLERTGAKIIVYSRKKSEMPNALSARGWQEIGNTSSAYYYVYFLQNTEVL